MNPIQNLIDDSGAQYPEQLISLCKKHDFGMVRRSGANGFALSNKPDMANFYSAATAGIQAAVPQDACQVLSFGFDPKTGDGNVDAVLSLVKTASQLKMSGKVVDIKNKKVLGKLPISPVEYNRSICTLKTGFHVSQTVAAADIAVLIEGEWEQGGEEHSIAVEHENVEGGFDPTYTHIWPKKEKSTVTIAIVDNAISGAEARTTVNAASSAAINDKIVISFNSTIYTTYAIDYRCNVKSAASGKPLFTAPGKGIISVPGASAVLSGAKGRCVVTQVDGGGAVIREYSLDYSPGVFSKVGDDLHYNMYMSWKTEYLGPRDPSSTTAGHLYNLTIDVPFQSEGGRTFNVRAVVSTSDVEPSPGTVSHKIPMLLYTWDCLVEHTPVTMADGSARAVETLRIGDAVMGKSGMSARITDIGYGIQNERLIELTVGANTLRLTPDHPVFTPKGWVAASLLKAGDQVGGVSGNWMQLDTVGRVAFTGGVYSIMLDGAGHTMFAAGFAVGDHDACQ